MAVYDSLISRVDAAPLIPAPVVQQIIAELPEQSAALRLFRRIPMSSKTASMPVLAALPMAYWVNGDTGLKQTTELGWDGVTITAEEVAAIVPIPEAVLDDAGFPVWDQVRPSLVAAIGRVLDAAVFFGTNAPASFSSSPYEQAQNDAGALDKNNVELGTATAATGGVSGDLNALFALVEKKGLDVNGIYADRALRPFLRGATDTTGQPLSSTALNEAFGVPITYGGGGLWPANVLAIAGDFTKGVIAVRQDVTFKVITEGVITDGAGAVVLNLPQQDSIALRVVARFGFATVNPINYVESDDDARRAWSVLINATP